MSAQPTQPSLYERLPFFGRNVQVFMRLTHRAPGIFLRPAARPANHLGNEIFETGCRYFVVGFVHSWVSVQAGIVHDAINQIVDDAGNAVNSAEAFVEGWLRWLC